MTYLCETCDMTAESSPEVLPDGWVDVTLCDADGNEVDGSFCSFECVKDWIDDLAEDAEGEDDDDDEDEDEDDDDDDDSEDE